MHFYTFRPPAPTVRTGTADAERRSARPRMVCGKGAGVSLGIGSRFRPPVNIAPPRPKAPLGAKIDVLGVSPANEWLPMPTAMSPMGNVRSRAVWTYRSASGLGGSRAERRRSHRHGAAQDSLGKAAAHSMANAGARHVADRTPSTSPSHPRAQYTHLHSLTDNAVRTSHEPLVALSV